MSFNLMKLLYERKDIKRFVKIEYNFKKVLLGNTLPATAVMIINQTLSCLFTHVGIYADSHISRWVSLAYPFIWRGRQE